MKKAICTALIVLLALTAVMATGCGSSGGSGGDGGSEAESKDIQVGEYTMKPEKWTKEGSDDGSQGLSFLIMGERIPVKMGLDASSAQAGFSVAVIDDETRYSATQVTYNKIDDQGAYKIRAVFYFPDIKDGQELPEKAEVSLTTGSGESAVADLTGLPVE
ncbi:MAG: hypothetical protein IKF07_00275 [Eubacterium sp.]|nr:hypothetical protein [Eubacterium sp.]